MSITLQIMVSVLFLTGLMVVMSVAIWANSRAIRSFDSKISESPTMNLRKRVAELEDGHILNGTKISEVVNEQAAIYERLKRYQAGIANEKSREKQAAVEGIDIIKIADEIQGIAPTDEQPVPPTPAQLPFRG